MPALSNLLFLIALGFLSAHELDAIQQREWRFFNQPFHFSEVIAFRLFTVIHIVLFAWVIGSSAEYVFRVGMSLFVMFHAGLHYMLRNHPLIEFRNVFSQFLIYGGVPFAALFLVVTFVR